MRVVGRLSGSACPEDEAINGAAADYCDARLSAFIWQATFAVAQPSGSDS